MSGERREASPSGELLPRGPLSALELWSKTGSAFFGLISFILFLFLCF
jgi:hypothetical protein